MYVLLRQQLPQQDIVKQYGDHRMGKCKCNSPPSSAVVKECVELYLHSASTP